MSQKVFPMRFARISSVGRLYVREKPRSPERTCLTHLMYRT